MRSDMWTIMFVTLAVLGALYVGFAYGFYHGKGTREPELTALRNDLLMARGTADVLRVSIDGAEQRARLILDAKTVWAERAHAAESQRTEALADLRRVLKPMLVQADAAVADLEDPPTVSQADHEHAELERARFERERDALERERERDREPVAIDDGDAEPPVRLTMEDGDDDEDD